MLLDEDGRRLYTIASRGYDAEGVGSEVIVGDGLIGLAAERCAPMRIGSLRQMAKYSRSVRRAYEDSGQLPSEPDQVATIALPGLPDAESRLAVPAMALRAAGRGPPRRESGGGRVLGRRRSRPERGRSPRRQRRGARAGEQRSRSRPLPPRRPTASTSRSARRSSSASSRSDGSAFLDGDYLIKGVAGRILWSIVGQHERDGRIHFTHRELRLDPSLDLPAFRDNLENRVHPPQATPGRARRPDAPREDGPGPVPPARPRAAAPRGALGRGGSGAIGGAGGRRGRPP